MTLTGISGDTYDSSDLTLDFATQRFSDSSGKDVTNDIYISDMKGFSGFDETRFIDNRFREAYKVKYNKDAPAKLDKQTLADFKSAIIDGATLAPRVVLDTLEKSAPSLLDTPDKIISLIKFFTIAVAIIVASLLLLKVLSLVKSTAK